MTNRRRGNSAADVLRVMMSQAVGAEDAPRQGQPAKSVPSYLETEMKALQNPEPENAALSADSIESLETKVGELSTFIAELTIIRARIAEDTHPEEGSRMQRVTRAHRRDLLTDLLAGETTLATAITRLTNISTRERQHFSDTMASTIRENADNRRAAYNREFDEDDAGEDEGGEIDLESPF